MFVGPEELVGQGGELLREHLFGEVAPGEQGEQGLLELLVFGEGGRLGGFGLATLEYVLEFLHYY